MLDLSSRYLEYATWTTPKYPATSNAQTLKVDFHGGSGFCTEEGCDIVYIGHYFDNTNPDGCLSGPGPGFIETIKFAQFYAEDPTSVDFAQAKSLLGCPKVSLGSEARQRDRGFRLHLMNVR